MNVKEYLDAKIILNMNNWNLIISLVFGTVTLLLTFNYKSFIVYTLLSYCYLTLISVIKINGVRKK